VLPVAGTVKACRLLRPTALAGTLGAYTATVTCTRSAHNEGGVAVNIDTIVATACNQPTAGNCPNAAPAAGYAERQISVMVGR
jgi:MSHA biogenesis protein MshP